MERDWGEALPWLLLAAREVVQESTGFSPNDEVLLPRGALAILSDQWRGEDPPRGLLDYVNGFRLRSYAASELARKGWRVSRGR